MKASRRIPWRNGLGRALHRLALLLALAACAGHDDEPLPPPPPSVGSATVGASGGTVSGPDGVSLSVAADPESTDTTFRIARDSTGAPTLAGMTLLSPIYAVTPHGTSFNTSALLKLPYDAGKAPPGATVVVLRGETDGTWHVSPVRSTVAGAAVVDVSGLSWYAIGVCTPGDAGVFGFGIGDCPANHELKLEFLDANGVAREVPRDALGYAAPFPPDITTATDVPLRLSWRRPPGMDRVDSVFLSGIGSGYIVNQQVNQPSWSLPVNVHLDPQHTVGAGGPNGVVKRLKARAEYCWVGFIIGRGDNQRVCWEFDADLAFRLRDGEPDPGLPTIQPQPLPVSVYEGHAATFHVDGQASDTLAVTWERKDPGSTWGLAQSFPSGGTPGNGGRDFTLAAVQSRADNGALFRAKVSNVSASGKISRPVYSDEVQLTVSTGGGLAIQWTAQPTLQPAYAGETVSLTMTANAVPYATVEVHRVSRAGVDEVVQLCAPAPVAITNASAALPQNPTTCGWTQGPVAVGDDGTQFYGLARSDVDPLHPLESNHVTLQVSPQAAPPTITTQPVSVTTAVGTAAVFSVVAASTANPSYEWQQQATGTSSWARLTDGPLGSGGASVAGSGSPTLTLTNVQLATAGSFRVVVSNGTAPDATSAAATLTVTPPPRVLAIAAGAGHTCALRSDGTVSCAGANGSGQAGAGTPGSPGMPVIVPGLAGVTALAAGYEHTCAVRVLGQVACWGADSDGQLGDSGALQGVPQSAPYTVPGLSGMVAVAAGGNFSCALRSSGGVICWGGSFGNPATSGGPVDVPGLTDAVALSAGTFHACAVRATGTLVCWGVNAYGQLGDGTLVDRSSPTTVPGLDNVAVVAAGQLHTCAARVDGTVRCWGSNRFGQFGTGVILANPVATPTVVPGLTDVSLLAAGAFYNCALRPSNQPVPLHGNLSCWGDNTAGQLGSVTAGFSPNELLLAPLKALTAGNAHTCAVTTDGTALCWGLNSYGQLGDGTKVNRAAPTPATF